MAQAHAAMGVLVQAQLPADAAFVLHTRSPMGGDGQLLAEVALGLGETLASGTRGSPWRLAVDKASGARRCSHTWARWVIGRPACAARPGAWL